MEREKRRSQEEEIHRVQINAPKRDDDEEDEEVEQQRERRPKGDSLCDGPGLQRLREEHPDAIPSDEISISPYELPTRRQSAFLRWRQRPRRKIDRLEIGAHRQNEVAHCVDA